MVKWVEKFKKVVENTTIQKLSNSEKFVLDKITKDFITIKQIAKIRGTSDKAVYKIISKLKKKGVLVKLQNSTYKIGVSSDTTNMSDNKLRLHAQSLQIRLISNSSTYENLLKLSNQDKEDGNTIQLYKDNITIYFNKSFMGYSVDECIKRGLLYIEKYLAILENKYKLILVKKNYNNIKFFRSEIAKCNDPLAKKVLNLNGEHFKVYDDLGVLRLIVDNSFKLSELETVSKEYAGDMRKVQDFYKDVLQNDTLLLSDIKTHLAMQQRINLTSNQRIDRVEQLLEGVVKTIGTNALIMQDMIKELDSLKTPSWKQY